MGKGCEGRLLMTEVANALAPTKPIQVIAANSLAEADLAGISSRNGSFDGKDVNYSRDAKGIESWHFRGLLSSETPSLVQVCSDMIKRFDDEVRLRPREVSSGAPDPHRDIRRDHYRDILAALEKLPSTASSNEVKHALETSGLPGNYRSLY